MPRSRLLALPALASLFLAAAPAAAAEFREYDDATFAKAKAEGRPVLIDVHAWWCPVCFSQTHTIRRLAAMPAYGKLLVLRVNYDKQKPVWQSFAVRKQGTLIGFHHGHEVARLAYITNGERIAALLDQTVA